MRALQESLSANTAFIDTFSSQYFIDPEFRLLFRGTAIFLQLFFQKEPYAFRLIVSDQHTTWKLIDFR